MYVYINIYLFIYLYMSSLTQTFETKLKTHLFRIAFSNA